jgi:glucokinase
VSWVPVLDIGGTHVSAAAVDTRQRRVVADTRTRRPLDSQGSAEQIIDAIAACAATLGDLSGRVLCVAIPGPFDYAAGIGLFEGVAKFEALRGVNLEQALLERLPQPARRVRFVNDAEAFVRGEYLAGAARGRQRVVGITLGTGVGSAFLSNGFAITAGPVPPHGRVDLLRIAGKPLEDTVSRRAILLRYQQLTGARHRLDVVDIANRAREGEQHARQVLDEIYRALGRALAPSLARFGAQALIIGGAIGNAFDLIGPPLRTGLDERVPHLSTRLPVQPQGCADAVEIGTACAAGRPRTVAPAESPGTTSTKAHR